MPPLPIEAYQVGWVCALPKELTAARAMLDEEHEEFKSQAAQDDNSYVLGRIHDHNVVLACLPAGLYGTVSAATVAINMVRTFTGIRCGLMVGIGGGIPNLSKGVDIRLGDVVVSQPDGTHGGVVQYDLGKNLGEGTWERKGVLRPPPKLLLTALANLQSRHLIYGNQISDILSDMVQRRPRMAKAGYIHPTSEADVLYCSNIEAHQDVRTCAQCQAGVIQRLSREDQSPEVHYGAIASGNQLMKNVVERDQLGLELGAKCVEMEAAGLTNDFPCIVIRGICDYADAHKNDVWQEYAAATAAAFAKELLSIVKPAEVNTVKHATEVMKYSLGLNLFDAPDMGEDLFIGRQAEIQQMASILQPQSNTLGSTRKPLILGGMGGIGKTQLAITYTKLYRSYYTSIFWLNATSIVSLKMSLRKVANRVLPPETVSKLDDEQIYIYVSNWFSDHANMRWLLIFDNYDDPDQYSLRPYFPSVAHGSIVVTTRQPDRVSGDQVRVRSMSQEDEGVRILATRSGREHVGSDPNARQLAQRLDGYPLALATAGAYLSQSPISFAKYLEQYEARWRVIESMDELADYPSRTLYSTWDLSFTQIAQQNPRAAHLFRFLAYLDHQDIWFELLHVGQQDGQPEWFAEIADDEFVFEDTMRILTRYCLAEAHYQTGSYSLHTVVHDWMLDGLNQQIDGRQFWLAFDCIASHIGADDWEYLSTIRYRRFTGHAKRLAHDRFRVVAQAQDSIQSRLDSMEYIAKLLQDQVQYNAADIIYLRALAGREKALGVDHTSTLNTVNNLGALYADQCKLDRAEEMYLRALAGREKALGVDHTSTLDTVNNLGVLYVDQGKLDRAEEMYLRALAGREKALGVDHTSTLNTVNNLGLLYADQGKLDRAEEMYLRALAGYEKTLEVDHTSTLNTVNNLGNLYTDQGKLDRAEEMYLRALAGYEKTLGVDHTATLDTVNNLGVLYVDQGKLDQAEEMYLRALAGYEKALGVEHTSTLETVTNLGALYADQGKLDRAEKMYLRALVGYEAVSQPETIPALNTIYNMGLLYRDQKRLEDAKSMLQRALTSGKKVLGSSHPYIRDVVYALEELASIKKKRRWDFKN